MSDTRDPDLSYPNHRPGLPPAVERMLEDRVRALTDTRMAYLDDTAEQQENAILRLITRWHLIDCTTEMAALRASVIRPTPPPDVIRRGHKALDDLERVVHAFPDDGRRSRIRWRVSEARAAMHPLPKEE